jgi:hypothetical protein
MSGLAFLEGTGAVVRALLASASGSTSSARTVGVLGPTAHPGLLLKVFLGVGRCHRL